MPMNIKTSLGNTLKLYSNKLEDIEEMDKFLHSYDILKLNQEDIRHLNGSLVSNEIKDVMKNLPTKQNPEQNGFSTELYQTNL
jgi:sugar/nucleoside kinase (ribokinase family)